MEDIEIKFDKNHAQIAKTSINYGKNLELMSVELTILFGDDLDALYISSRIMKM